MSYKLKSFVVFLKELYKFSRVESLEATLAAESVQKRLLHCIIFNGIVCYIFQGH